MLWQTRRETAVSHDLKNPLVTILSFTGMLRQDAARGDAERVENDLSRIETAADRMYRLLEDLLELSRIGRVVNVSEVVSLNTQARQAVAMLSGLIVARGVRVEVQASTIWRLFPGLERSPCDRAAVSDMHR